MDAAALRTELCAVNPAPDRGAGREIRKTSPIYGSPTPRFARVQSFPSDASTSGANRLPDSAPKNYATPQQEPTLTLIVLYTLNSRLQFKALQVQVEPFEIPIILFNARLMNNETCV